MSSLSLACSCDKPFSALKSIVLVSLALLCVGHMNWGPVARGALSSTPIYPPDDLVNAGRTAGLTAQNQDSPMAGL